MSTVPPRCAEHRSAAAARILASITSGDITTADAELDADPRYVAISMTIVCLGLLEELAGGPANLAAAARAFAVSLATAEVLDPSEAPDSGGRRYRDHIDITWPHPGGQVPPEVPG